MINPNSPDRASQDRGRLCHATAANHAAPASHVSSEPPLEDSTTNSSIGDQVTQAWPTESWPVGTPSPEKGVGSSQCDRNARISQWESRENDSPRLFGRSHLCGLFVLCLLWGCSKTNSKSLSDPKGSQPSGTNRQTETDNPTVSTAARFLDRTAASGVKFTYANGQDSGHASIVESLGGGAALLDFDRDGRLDLFLPGGGKYVGRTMSGLNSALFRNVGSGTDWRFRDVTASAGVGFAPYYSHGAAVGDYDSDGLPDVLVTGYGGLILFRNMGDGTFEETAKPAGLTDTLWSSSAAWGDFNGDGHLDLYVARYANWSWANHPLCEGPKKGLREVCPPRRFEPLPDSLYLNNGDGTFRDASKAAGLSTKGKGLGVVVADLDLDGRLDIYVGNDTVPNFLYRNLGNGKFEEIGLKSGTSLGDTGVPEGSMGVDVGDFNRDGRPDIFVANYESESFGLYRNDGGTNFTHVSQGTGITALGGLYVGWGSVFFDFDRDGDEDIFIANGHVIRFPRGAPLKQKPILLENRNGKRFVNVASAAGKFFRQDHMGRGVAVGDIDNDGDLDLVVVRTNQPVSLLSNETKSDNGWLSLRLIGTKSSRDPIGAVLFLETSSGRQMRQVKGGRSYASTCDPRVFFGLGKSKIRKLEIRWPSGKRQIIDNIAPNRFHTLVEPK